MRTRRVHPPQRLPSLLVTIGLVGVSGAFTVPTRADAAASDEPAARVEFSVLTGEQTGIAPLLAQWKAEEAANPTECAGVPGFSWELWGMQSFDYDSDGDVDLLIGQHACPGGMLLKNQVDTGQLTFSSAHQDIGLPQSAFPQNFSRLFDFDGDGRVDILGAIEGDAIVPRVLHNVANNRFEIFWQSGIFAAGLGVEGTQLNTQTGALDVIGLSRENRWGQYLKYTYNPVSQTYSGPIVIPTTVDVSIPSYVPQSIKDDISARMNAGSDATGNAFRIFLVYPDINRDGLQDFVFGAYNLYPAMITTSVPPDPILRVCIRQTEDTCVDRTTAIGLPTRAVPLLKDIYGELLDLSGDGAPDFLIDDRGGGRSGFYLNDGQGNFTRQAGDLNNLIFTLGQSTGIETPPVPRPVDLKNDASRPDLLIQWPKSNCSYLLQNNGGGNFVQLFSNGIINSCINQGISADQNIIDADFNNDGLLDLAVLGGGPGSGISPGSAKTVDAVTLLINKTQYAGNYVDIYPKIPAPTYNPFAVGAGVSIYPAGTMFQSGAKPILAVSTNPDGKPIHVGLGSATAFDLRVRFPNGPNNVPGTVVEKQSLAANSRLQITPDGQVTVLPQLRQPVDQSTPVQTQPPAGGWPSDGGGTPAPTPPVPPATLVGYWNFDDRAGQTARDSSGAGTDAAVNGAAWSTDGKFGGAVLFNGVTSAVRIPYTPALAQSNSTITAWIKPSTLKFGGIFGGIAGTNNVGYTGDLALSADGRLQLENPGANGYDNFSKSAIPVNQWTFVAVSQWKMYINGTLQYPSADWYVNPEDVVGGTGALTIGNSWTDGVQRYFDGLIDDVRIYNRALTDAEILGLYQTTPPSAPPSGPLRGDLTGDGQVTLADLRRMIKMFLGLVPMDLATADLTGEGTLTLADLRALVGILVGRGG